MERGPTQLPTLQAFEHDLKLFVDCGMFFFLFANAGVTITAPGGLTISIILALVAGKTIGIAGFAIAGDIFGKSLHMHLVFAGCFALLCLSCAWQQVSNFRPE